jgi:iron complex outermembrane receptor protein
VRYTYLAGDMSRGELLNKYTLEHLTHQLIAQVEWRTGKTLQHSAVCRYLERFSGQQYAVLDYRVRVTKKQFSSFADVANILDRAYVESGFVPMPGRWFRLGVEWRI